LGIYRKQKKKEKLEKKMKKKEKQSKKIKGWKVIFLKKIVKLDSEKGRMINGESWGVFQLL